MGTTLWLDTRRPVAGLLSLAAAAESAGWDGLRVIDTPEGRECWALAGALSAIPRIRIEVVVDPSLARHPAVVAKLASTVDQLSGGRLLLGFLPDRSVEGSARLGEAVRLVKILAAGQPATWRGRFYRLEDAPLDPPTVQHPFPVMLVGGTAAEAATWADRWSLSGPPATVAEQVRALAAACRAAGRDPATIAIAALAADHPVPAGPDSVAADVIIADSALGSDPALWQQRLAQLSAG